MILPVQSILSDVEEGFAGVYDFAILCDDLRDDSADRSDDLIEDLHRLYEAHNLAHVHHLAFRNKWGRRGIGGGVIDAGHRA